MDPSQIEHGGTDPQATLGMFFAKPTQPKPAAEAGPPNDQPEPAAPGDDNTPEQQTGCPLAPTDAAQDDPAAQRKALDAEERRRREEEAAAAKEAQRVAREAERAERAAEKERVKAEKAAAKEAARVAQAAKREAAKIERLKQRAAAKAAKEAEKASEKHEAQLEQPAAVVSVPAREVQQKHARAEEGAEGPTGVPAGGYVAEDEWEDEERAGDDDADCEESQGASDDDVTEDEDSSDGIAIEEGGAAEVEDAGRPARQAPVFKRGGKTRGAGARQAPKRATRAGSGRGGANGQGSSRAVSGRGGKGGGGQGRGGRGKAEAGSDDECVVVAAEGKAAFFLSAAEKQRRREAAERKQAELRREQEREDFRKQLARSREETAMMNKGRQQHAFFTQASEKAAAARATREQAAADRAAAGDAGLAVPDRAAPWSFMPPIHVGASSAPLGGVHALPAHLTPVNSPPRPPTNLPAQVDGFRLARVAPTTARDSSVAPAACEPSETCTFAAMIESASAALASNIDAGDLPDEDFRTAEEVRAELLSGVDAARCLAHERNAAAAIAAGTEAGGAQLLLWTDAYAPSCAADVCGNAGPAEQLRRWLAAWSDRMEREKLAGGAAGAAAPGGKRKRRRRLEDTDSDDDDFGAGLLPRARSPSAGGDDSDGELPCAALGSSALLLHGPAGSGKTAAVQAVARELGYRLIEVSPANARDGASVNKRVGEATQSRQSAKTAVVFEEIDVLAEHDRGFAAALASLIHNTKRPIILTARHAHPSAARDVAARFLPRLRFAPPSHADIARRLAVVCGAADRAVPFAVIDELAAVSASDLRQALTAAEAWLGARGGAERAVRSLRTADGCSLAHAWETVAAAMSAARDDTNAQVNLAAPDVERSPCAIEAAEQSVASALVARWEEVAAAAAAQAARNKAQMACIGRRRDGRRGRSAPEEPARGLADATAELGEVEGANADAPDGPARPEGDSGPVSGEETVEEAAAAEEPLQPCRIVLSSAGAFPEQPFAASAVRGEPGARWCSNDALALLAEATDALSACDSLARYRDACPGVSGPSVPFRMGLGRAAVWARMRAFGLGQDATPVAAHERDVAEAERVLEDAGCDAGPPRDAIACQPLAAEASTAVAEHVSKLVPRLAGAASPDGAAAAAPRFGGAELVVRQAEVIEAAGTALQEALCYDFKALSTLGAGGLGAVDRVSWMVAMAAISEQACGDGRTLGRRMRSSGYRRRMGYHWLVSTDTITHTATVRGLLGMRYPRLLARM
ncbi:unnamed protein product [Pedinophyceae sp. YPF-701]|nr:unnamed protein product [Pedinophyceae sp. YPF-701]